LIGVVSLPTPFVFRTNDDDPHPMPWIRVMLSAAIGGVLYPHEQWSQIAATWESFYPLQGLDENTASLIAQLRAEIPSFVKFLASHRPSSLKGKSLADALEPEKRQPALLLRHLAAWEKNPAEMYEAPPSLVFAVIGQARYLGKLSPEDESTLLAKLLTHWALKTTLDVSSYCGHHLHRNPRPAASAASRLH
jgi:hypothetical protein